MIDEGCVVTPLNSGQSISFFSPTGSEGLCLDNGPFADCPSALSLCSWYPEDLYEGQWGGERRCLRNTEWNNITFLLILPAINIICIPPDMWALFITFRVVGRCEGQVLLCSRIFQCIRYSALHVSVALLNHGPKQTRECYKEKRSVNIPTALCNVSWISYVVWDRFWTLAEEQQDPLWKPEFPHVHVHTLLRLMYLWWVMLTISVMSWRAAVLLRLSTIIFLLYYFSSNKYLLCLMGELDIPARWNQGRQLLHK